jgi:methylenetetrahydrofolate reductase (NADPH)
MITTQKAEPAAEPALGPAPMRMLESVGELARRASIETSARNLVDVDAYPSLLPPGTDVFAAWIPGSPYHHIVSIAKRLRQAGMNPVPHIAARQLTDRAMAAEYLSRLRDEAGVTRALIVGGDTDEPAGIYDSSAALMETGLLQAHGIRSIGITGYPEGHPKIPEASLMAAMDRKIGYAKAQGLDLFMATQFCFDGQAIVGWLRRLRARGVALPVRVGVAGPATLRTLLNYGVRCGVGNSIRALRSQATTLTRLVGQQGPDTVVRAIAPSASELNVVGLHLFPFGGFAQSAKWMDNAAAGRILLGEPGAQVGVETHPQAS